MFKKIKFTVFNVSIALLLFGAIFYIIVALQTDKLNLSPLFAAIFFVLAFLLVSIRSIIRFFLSDKKASIAEEISLVIVFLIFFFFCIILLNINGIL